MATSNAAYTVPKQCSALKKGEFVMLKGKPCKISEMSTSKTGKHGHAKVHLVGFDIFDQKKTEDICPSTHSMQCPTVTRKEYQLLDVSEEGFMSLMDDSGETSEHLKCGDLEKEIKKVQSEAEKKNQDVFVTIMSAMGKEKAVAVKSAK